MNSFSAIVEKRESVHSFNRKPILIVGIPANNLPWDNPSTFLIHSKSDHAIYLPLLDASLRETVAVWLGATSIHPAVSPRLSR